jgi:hypothetical protein
MRQLRDELQANGLLEILDGGVPAAIYARYRPTPTHAPSPVQHCDRHGGYFDPDDPASRPNGACAVCPCPVEQHTGRGRRRRYCSDACRQAAHRRRTKSRADRRAAQVLMTTVPGHEASCGIAADHETARSPRKTLELPPNRLPTISELPDAERTPRQGA